MPIRKIMKSVPADILAAEGLFQQDQDALTPCQRESIIRTAMTLQLEQEAYLTQHPELLAMLQLFMSKMAGNLKKKCEPIKEAYDYFLRPLEELDGDIRKLLGVADKEPYIKADKPVYYLRDDEQLINDLNAIRDKHFPHPPWSVQSSEPPLLLTESSSFMSVLTSDTTLPTPEPIPTPEPTLSENLFSWISNTVDKAVYIRVDDATLLYDTAYVELSKAVEAAMEIPVIDIKEDIANLFIEAYKFFEIDIIEKERIAAEIAWDKRMRKKMKRTVRRQANFKGYETPPTPKSSVSSHESYRIAPPRPCICHPQWHYNRYGKDRFGIYLPRQDEYNGENVTATPVLSSESIHENVSDNDDDARSGTSKTSRKSTVSTKSYASQKKNNKT